MNSLISLDLDHNNFGDNLAEPGRFNGLNVLQVMTKTIMVMTMIMIMIMLMNVIKGRYDDDDDVDDDMMMISSRCHCVGTG